MSAPRLMLAIAAGGALGAMARFATSLLAQALLPSSLIAGTLAANGIGSFLIGFVAAWATRRFPSPLVSGFLVTGFCGGFTTFSVFSLETVTLLISGETLAALGYVAASVAICLLMVWLGWLAGTVLVRRSAIES